MMQCEKCGTSLEADASFCTACGASVKKEEPRTTREAWIEDAAHSPTLQGAVRYSYTSTFKTARIIAQLISFVGWVVIIISALILFPVFQSGNEFALLALFPSLGGMLVGLFLVNQGQLTRATIDGTDFSGEMLALEKNSHEEETVFRTQILRILKK